MHFSHVGLKDFLPFLLTVLVLRSLPTPGGRVSIRVFEKCWRFVIKQAKMSFVNEISGIASGLVTHGLGDLDFWRDVGT